MNDKPRLIDADALKKELDAWASPIRNRKFYVRDDAICVIDAAPTVDAVPQWIPVTERLPEENIDVLITFRELMQYNNKYRHGICKAMHVKEHSIKVDDLWSYNECKELEIYDESEDLYYVKSGWYEIVENYDEYTHIYINAGVTAWMPLPKPYKMDGKDGNEDGV